MKNTERTIKLVAYESLKAMKKSSVFGFSQHCLCSREWSPIGGKIPKQEIITFLTYVSSILRAHRLNEGPNILIHAESCWLLLFKIHHLDSNISVVKINAFPHELYSHLKVTNSICLLFYWFFFWKFSATSFWLSWSVNKLN